MTNIAAGMRGTPTGSLRAAAPGSGSSTEHAAERSSTRLLIGAGVATGVAAAVAGAAYLRFGGGSRVVDVIDGVQLLSNPRTPGIFNKPRWGVPSDGAVFGAAPGPRVSIEHVDQGALGDCWNIAGMGAIADHRPDVFERMVREVGGHIEVALPERTVRITRELPLRADGAPKYGGTDPRVGSNGEPSPGQVDRVLWPAYVEKAQAALTRRGYSDLAGGWTKDSFRQLLGTNPVRVSAHAPIDDYVIGHLRSKTPAAISTLSNTTAPAAVTRRMAELDIKHNHYYVPVGLTGDGPSATVKLFNPWGDSHPRRELSRDDLRLIFHGIDTPDDYIRF